jgi:hypothetical protein
MCLRLATVLDPPVGRRTGADRANRTPARIEDKVAATQQKTARSIASGWGRGRRAGSIVRRQQIHLHGQPGGTNEQYLLSDPNCCPSGSPPAARSLPPYVPQRQDHHALVDPDGSGLVTKAISDPTLHAWWEALISTR